MMLVIFFLNKPNLIAYEPKLRITSSIKENYGFSVKYYNLKYKNYYKEWGTKIYL